MHMVFLENSTQLKKKKTMKTMKNNDVMHMVFLENSTQSASSNYH